jgi:hypothetical protein
MSYTTQGCPNIDYFHQTLCVTTTVALDVPHCEGTGTCLFLHCVTSAGSSGPSCACTQHIHQPVPYVGTRCIHLGTVWHLAGNR